MPPLTAYLAPPDFMDELREELAEAERERFVTK